MLCPSLWVLWLAEELKTDSEGSDLGSWPYQENGATSQRLWDQAFWGLPWFSLGLLSCPKKSISCWWNCTLFFLFFSLMNLFNFVIVRTSLFSLNTRMSLKKHTACSSPAMISCMVHWKIYGTDLMPRVNLHCRPNGLINVVSLADSSSSGICQNLLMASNLVKMVDPFSLWRMSSTVSKAYLSHLIAAFSFL